MNTQYRGRGERGRAVSSSPKQMAAGRRGPGHGRLVRADWLWIRWVWGPQGYG